MALSKKAALRAGALGLVALTGVVVIGVELARSDASVAQVDPAPGTYADAPEQIWSAALPGPNASVLAVTDTRVVLAATRSEGSNEVVKLVGINIETGEVAWERTLPSYKCGGGIGRYEPDSSVVVCLNDSPGLILTIDPENGEDVLRAFFAKSYRSDVLVSGDTVYTCTADDYSVNFNAGSGDKLENIFSIDIPADKPSGCTLDYSQDHVLVYNAGDDFVTIADLEGSIVYQSFETSASFLEDGNLVAFRSGSEYKNDSSIIDVNGNYIRDWDDNASTSVALGREHARAMIDDVGAVRDRWTHEMLWDYAGPDDFSMIGSVGDVLVMREAGSRLRGYEMNTGTPLWAESLSRFYSARQLPTEPDFEGDFSESSARWRVKTDGEFLVITSGSALSGLNARTGGVPWTKPVRGWILRQHQDYLFLSDKTQLIALQFD